MIYRHVVPKRCSANPPRPTRAPAATEQTRTPTPADHTHSRRRMCPRINYARVLLYSFGGCAH